VNKYPKVNLIVEEYNTEEILYKLKNGQLDAAIAATPLLEQDIKEVVLYYEPFVGYLPESFRNGKTLIEPDDLDINDILLLKDGHCFRNGILNICKNSKKDSAKRFELTSGSFETLIKLSNEGLGVTLLPYLHSLNLNEFDVKNIVPFKDPKPSREVSLIYFKSELKSHIIEALRDVISGVVRGAITFQDVKIISPKLKKQATKM